MFGFMRGAAFKFGLAGAAVVLVGGKLLKSKAAHDAAVNITAWGMQLKDNISESLRNVRDEAADICDEAKRKNESDDSDESDKPED